MEEKTNLLESLVDQATDYAQSSLILIKLKAIDKSSDVLSSVFSSFIWFLIISVCVFFANMGLAFYFAEMLGSLQIGFFVVSTFYLVLALFIYLFFRKKIKRLAQNIIIKQMLK